MYKKIGRTCRFVTVLTPKKRSLEISVESNFAYVTRFGFDLCSGLAHLAIHSHSFVTFYYNTVSSMFSHDFELIKKNRCFD
jgi:hypothetical protein